LLTEGSKQAPPYQLRLNKRALMMCQPGFAMPPGSIHTAYTARADYPNTPIQLKATYSKYRRQMLSRHHCNMAVNCRRSNTSLRQARLVFRLQERRKPRRYREGSSLPQPSIPPFPVTAPMFATHSPTAKSPFLMLLFQLTVSSTMRGPMLCLS